MVAVAGVVDVAGAVDSRVYQRWSESLAKETNGMKCKHKTGGGFQITWIMDYGIVEGRIRKALTWVACNDIEKLWRSNLEDSSKLCWIQTLVEAILLHRSETRTLPTKYHKRSDGTYTNPLCRAQTIHWSEHATRKEYLEFFQQHQRSSGAGRLLQLSGHCIRAEQEA